MELNFSNLIPQCTFNQLKQIHAFIITTSLLTNIQILSKFLRRSTEFGCMGYFNLIFSQMGHVFNTEIMLWNAMLRGYAFNGPFEKCIYMFDEMPRRGLKPDSYTYPYVLNSCVQMGFYGKGKSVHCQIIKSGFEFNFSVASSLFDMYLKMPVSYGVGFFNNARLSDALKVFDHMCTRPVEVWNRMIFEYVNVGEVNCARELFDNMLVRDVVSWNSMISGYSKVGKLANARDLFERMPEKNVVSWTAMVKAYANVGDLKTARKFFEKMPCRNLVSWNCMLSSYTQNEKYEEVLDLFAQMQSEGLSSDGFTFASVLTACANLGDLEFGKWVHYSMKDWSQLAVVVGTALIEMYARCGDIEKACTVFLKIGKKDVFCWNVMIKSLAVHGRTEDAIKIFFWMQKMGLNPNEFTYSSALFACSHGGFVEEGRRIFRSMDKEHGIRPKHEHFCCMIDLLSRNGQLEEAQLLLKEMPIEPDIAIWGALLGGCRVSSDLNLAEKVVERASELEASEPGVYILLSNIHASMGQWAEAQSAREKMEGRNMWKKAGSSSVA
ncbi:PPR domain-containing protein/PPR_2 domain-containing protein [Cephalotus follicularis]|uniref:PPR domain-containing protein/PPR_2 domain-containing protein n=1 Tax=Cephalotus follicularis TaxID=3775 RepID=A0A1Q3CMI3_CEPFO|nr:PPR domain-containing protein/PPR_2 domain-containing protein [Cephalotus follicularis]